MLDIVQCQDHICICVFFHSIEVKSFGRPYATSFINSFNPLLNNYSLNVYCIKPYERCGACGALPIDLQDLIVHQGSEMHTGRILSYSSAKLRGNCYISLSHLLDCGYRIRKERKAKMIRKASGGGRNELNLEGRIFSQGTLFIFDCPLVPRTGNVDVVECVQTTRPNSRQLIDDGSVPRLSLRILLKTFIAMAK